MKLTPENYDRGFLIDGEWMGSVSKDPTTNDFLAFILNHLAGESVTTRVFRDLDSALLFINQVDRPWGFESTKACGKEACQNNASGVCLIGGCNPQNKTGPTSEEKCCPSP